MFNAEQSIVHPLHLWGLGSKTTMNTKIHECSRPSQKDLRICKCGNQECEEPIALQHCFSFYSCQGIKPDPQLLQLQCPYILLTQLFSTMPCGINDSTV